MPCEDTDTRRGAVEAETGGRQLQAKEHQGLLETLGAKRKAWNRFPLESSEGMWAC